MERLVVIQACNQNGRQQKFYADSLDDPQVSEVYEDMCRQYEFVEMCEGTPDNLQVVQSHGRLNQSKGC